MRIVREIAKIMSMLRVFMSLLIAGVTFASVFAIGAIPLGLLFHVLRIDRHDSWFAIFSVMPAAVVALFALMASWDAFGPMSDSRKRGYCEACGYNLRGNVSGVCPECGVAIGRGP